MTDFVKYSDAHFNYVLFTYYVIIGVKLLYN